MKLQNLIIIFIIIILPIIFIFSLYLNLETKTISLQTDYDGKLLGATKEAMEAFEVNTTQWSSKYASLANAKRQILMSSVNTFTTSLASKLGISGTSKENILNYVPAIIFIMYDGYYIYSPTYVPETITNENGVQLFYYESSGSEGTKITALATQNISGTIVAGEPIYVCKTGSDKTGTYNGETIAFTTDISKAKKTYKHVLKTFVPYTTTYYDNSGNDYIINYTLDNYIRIFGEIQSKEGYVIEDFGNTNTIEIPVNNISGIKANGNKIEAEKLTENIYVKGEFSEAAQLETYPYIYNSNNDKRYYDSAVDKFFVLNNDNVKVYLPDSYIGHTVAEYKKVLVRTSDTNYEYLELYQLINGDDRTWYYKQSENQYLPYEIEVTGIETITREKDCSAINYYVETCSFNYWIKNNNIETDKIMAKKNSTIVENINNNLNLSISNYNANTKLDYEIFELSDEDWEQALSNISIITFFQGIKTGLKVYNNYAIATSTENNEYVSEDSLYYIGVDDKYYHRYKCNASSASTYQAYRNTDFNVQNYEQEETVKYYYKHTSTSGEKLQECYDCIVNRNNYERCSR